MWDFHNDESDDEGDDTAEINANEIHMRSKGLLPGATKPLDQTKQDVHPMKASAPRFLSRRVGLEINPRIPQFQVT